VFLAAIDSARTYDRRRGEPLPWLYGVARNVVSAEWRRSAQQRTATRRIQDRALVDEDDLASLDERIDAEARRRELFSSLERLPEGERAVLELVALEGLTPVEAARALGIRPVTARVRLHRARRLLRAELDSPSVDVNALPEVIS
jgi:RNA polymerase sigma factor (sigma-70 family)